jgi:hypothetical protein
MMHDREWSGNAGKQLLLLLLIFISRTKVSQHTSCQLRTA